MSEETAPRPWAFGPEAACQYIASVSWPYERREERDSWAVTMLSRPDLLAVEVTEARRRLEGAIACALAPHPTTTERQEGTS